MLLLLAMVKYENKHLQLGKNPAIDYYITVQFIKLICIPLPHTYISMSKTLAGCFDITLSE